MTKRRKLLNDSINDSSQKELFADRRKIPRLHPTAGINQQEQLVS
jgi:hypothetical protein